MNNNLKTWIFPNYFKYIGAYMILLLFVFILVTLVLQLKVEPSLRAMYKMIFFDLLILAFVFITWAKEKNETEVISQKWIQLLASSFMGGLAIVIIKPLVDLLFRDSISPIDSGRLVLIILGMHSFNFYIYKLNSRGKDNN
jgi:hypothetical protein